jgi:hypothetical protein
MSMVRTSVSLLATIAILLCGVLMQCLGIPHVRPCEVPRHVSEQDLVGAWQISYSAVRRYASDPIEGSLVVTGTMPYLVAPGATPMPLSRCEWLVGFSGQLADEDVAWQQCAQLRREGHLMSGEQTIVLHEDGTYQQVFASDTYSYTSPLYQWELITDTPDGPKLRMEGMKYFAEGIAQANSSTHMVLLPQTIDLQRIQEYVESTEPRPDGAGDDVLYPDSGHIYLYPRECYMYPEVRRTEFTLVQMRWRLGDPDVLGPSNPVFRRIE